jgi:hypothetical protein
VTEKGFLKIGFKGMYEVLEMLWIDIVVVFRD